MSKPVASTRRYIELTDVRKFSRAAYDILKKEHKDAGLSLKYSDEQTDLCFYMAGNPERMYLESHDEYCCSMWNGTAWEQVKWEDRPT